MLSDDQVICRCFVDILILHKLRAVIVNISSSPSAVMILNSENSGKKIWNTSLGLLFYSGLPGQTGQSCSFYSIKLKQTDGTTRSEPNKRTGPLATMHLPNMWRTWKSLRRQPRCSVVVRLTVTQTERFTYCVHPMLASTQMITWCIFFYWIKFHWFAFNLWRLSNTIAEAEFKAAPMFDCWHRTSLTLWKDCWEASKMLWSYAWDIIQPYFTICCSM